MSMTVYKVFFKEISFFGVWNPLKKVFIVNQKMAENSKSLHILNIQQVQILTFL